MEEIKKNLARALERPFRLAQSLPHRQLPAFAGGARRVVYLASQPKLTLLYGGMPPAEAAKVVEYLDRKKSPTMSATAAAPIMVPAAQVYSVRMGLATQGIPTMSDGGVGFELFDKPTFGMSDFMQRANYYRALQGELVPDHPPARRGRQRARPDRRAGRQAFRPGPPGSQGVGLHPASAGPFARRRARSAPSASSSPTAWRASSPNASRWSTAPAGRWRNRTTRSGGRRSAQRQATPGPRRPGKLFAGKSAEHARPGARPGPGRGARRLGNRLQPGAGNHGKVRPEEFRHHHRNDHHGIDHDQLAGRLGGGAGVTANTASSDGLRRKMNEKEGKYLQPIPGRQDVESRVIGAGSIKRLTVALMLNEKKPATPGGKPAARTPQEIQQSRTSSRRRSVSPPTTRARIRSRARKSPSPTFSTTRTAAPAKNDHPGADQQLPALRHAGLPRPAGRRHPALFPQRVPLAGEEVGTNPTASRRC